MLGFRNYAASVALMAALLNLPSGAATLTEDFSQPPSTGGWQVLGDTNLFHWDATANNLQVTWDSSKTNSYFCHPLRTVLTREDDFDLSFDLHLDDLHAGINPNKPYAFPIAIGFLNRANATDPGFRRGTGVNATNLVELSYFGDTGYGATVWPIFISSNGVYNYTGSSDYTLYELPTGANCRIVMRYTASNHVMKTSLTVAQTDIPLNEVALSSSFDDFRADTISISSYSDAGDDWDSVLAHGKIDNIVVTVPEPPLGKISAGFIGQSWQATFESHTNWIYTLERTDDLASWNVVKTADGSGAGLSLLDATPPSSRAFYRVGARRR